MISLDLTADLPGFTLRLRASWTAAATALFGASGAGKSTVLEGIAGLRREVRGSMKIGDREISGLPPQARRVGWVPQESSVFPHMTVRENLAFASRCRGGAPMDRAIEVLDLGPILDRSASVLSGGERQRVAIARALASAPDLLLLDEPLSSVDLPLRARIATFLAAIPKATGVPILLVTHDPREVRAVVGHVLVLEQGKLVREGDPRAVFASAGTFGGLDALGAENRFQVRQISSTPGLLALETPGGCRLEMAAVAGFAAPGRVAIRAEDILLASSVPEAVSAQNVLEGVVEGLETIDDQVYVAARVAGERWTAKVTQRACDRLALKPGGRVVLVIKAQAVHGED